MTLRALHQTTLPQEAKASAGGGNRTHTGGDPHGILSPARLPVSPLRHVVEEQLLTSVRLLHCQIEECRIECRICDHSSRSSAQRTPYAFAALRSFGNRAPDVSIASPFGAFDPSAILPRCEYPHPSAQGAARLPRACAAIGVEHGTVIEFHDVRPCTTPRSPSRSADPPPEHQRTRTLSASHPRMISASCWLLRSIISKWLLPRMPRSGR